MSDSYALWGGFGLLMLVMFALDLGVFNRKSREVGFRQAALWAAAWTLLALLFGGAIYLFMGPVRAMEFYAGWIIELSLSVDNLFVFIVIFSYFRVSKKHQPKILKWGIIGALVLRALFIVAGIELINRFHWAVYIFGAILIYTAVKMAFGDEEGPDPGHNLLVRLARRFIPVTSRPHGDRFLVRRRGITAVTPLFLTLLVVESSDLLFAVDSIPAILSVTRDPFIVYTSNIFAIMGLRSLYYLLAGVMGMFAYLKFGVSCILAFVGAKMLLADVVEIPVGVSLCVIVAVIALSIMASLLWKPKEE